MKFCLLCGNKKASAFFQKKIICTHCFMKIQDKAIPKDELTKAGIKVDWKLKSNAFGWLDELARKQR
jgi:hypothetical protein